MIFLHKIKQYLTGVKNEYIYSNKNVDTICVSVDERIVYGKNNRNKNKEKKIRANGQDDNNQQHIDCYMDNHWPDNINDYL